MRLRQQVARADRRVERGVQPTRSGRALAVLTAAGSLAGDAGLAATAGLRARHAGVRPAGLVALVTVLAAERLVTGALKHGVSRPRPPERFHPPVSAHPSTGGFPSGHTSLGFFSVAVLQSRRRRAALYPVAVGVALARLHQGLHWPSDLVLGALLGTAAGRLANRLGGVGPAAGRPPLPQHGVQPRAGGQQRGGDLDEDGQADRLERDHG